MEGKWQVSSLQVASSMCGLKGRKNSLETAKRKSWFITFKYRKKCFAKKKYSSTKKFNTTLQFVFSILIDENGQFEGVLKDWMYYFEPYPCTKLQHWEKRDFFEQWIPTKNYYFFAFADLLKNLAKQSFYKNRFQAIVGALLYACSLQWHRCNEKK